MKLRSSLLGAVGTALIACQLFAVQPSRSRPLPSQTSSEVLLGLEKLQVLGSALYIAAHPDDENTAMIAWLSKGRLVRTGYLAMTRGDGGQNLIGTEKGDLLGVIRTEELLSARAIDGGEQFFTRAIDFGYSKSPEETLQVWGHDEILADVVWVIRIFRPDILITRFPASGTNTHGHHTASAILANEAFEAAGDPSRFSEQLEHVEPWRPRRIFWDSWRPRVETPPEDLSYLTVELGDYNTMLGRSYAEISGLSRSMHKSQGFGAPQRKGAIQNHLELTGGDSVESDPFDGIDMTWGRVEGGERVERLISEAIVNFDASAPSKTVPVLLRILDAMDQLPSQPWLTTKREELLELIRSASGLWIEAIAEAPQVVPGRAAKISVGVINRSQRPVTITSVETVNVSKHEADTVLKYNETFKLDLEVSVADDAPPTQPYWLWDRDGAGRFRVGDYDLLGRPENRTAFPVRITASIDGHLMTWTVPTLYRWIDDVEGEKYRPLEIVPPATMNFAEPLYVFAGDEPKEVRLSVRSAVDEFKGMLEIDVPKGWKVEPASIEVAIPKASEERAYAFLVTPSGPAVSSDVEARIAIPGQILASSRATIDYPHIAAQTVLVSAESYATKASVVRRRSRIGYVMGSGDEIPGALEQIGYEIVLLDDDDIDADLLAEYPAVVVGVRAFNTRPRLVERQSDLNEYVRRGGTLVVQYNTLSNGFRAGPGPYEFEISRDRVTDEASEVRFVDPSHPLLSTPNKITSKDFEGWIQERGLYFPGKWSDEYQPVLSMNDTGEDPLLGSLLYARYGEGVYIYTGLSFFRELPAGVAGAYRLFVNLVEAE